MCVCVCPPPRGLGLSGSLHDDSRLMGLQAELQDLEVREAVLDQQQVWLQQSIQNSSEDSHNFSYPCPHGRGSVGVPSPLGGLWGSPLLWGVSGGPLSPLGVPSLLWGSPLSSGGPLSLLTDIFSVFLVLSATENRHSVGLFKSHFN